MAPVLITVKHGTPESRSVCMCAPSRDQGPWRLGPASLFCVPGTWTGSESRGTVMWLCCGNAGLRKQQLLQLTVRLRGDSSAPRQVSMVSLNREPEGEQTACGSHENPCASAGAYRRRRPPRSLPLLLKPRGNPLGFREGQGITWGLKKALQ